MDDDKDDNNDCDEDADGDEEADGNDDEDDGCEECAVDNDPEPVADCGCIASSEVSNINRNMKAE